MKYFFLISVIFFFIGCDESFDITNPTGSKLGYGYKTGKCLENNDCNSDKEACNLNTENCENFIEQCGENCLKNNCNFNIEQNKFECKMDEESPCFGIICNGYGVCSVEDNEAVCSCNQGFYNDPSLPLKCVNPCENIDCGDGGVCEASSFSQKECICNAEDGYFQAPDNKFICKNPCTNQTCSGHGSCNALSYSEAECVCDEDYFLTESKLSCVNPCDGKTCSGHGNCIADSYSESHCECDEENGYFSNGENSCVNPCNSITCSFHGECIATAYNEATCECDDGYFNNGENKLSCVTPCNGQFCNNHGACVATSYNKATCECEEGYYNFGDDKFSCIDPCSGQTCSNHGSCSATDYNNAYCTCDETNGYYQNPDNIMECINPCNGEYCSYHGECVSTAYNEASCRCEEGYFNNPDDNMECSNPCSGKVCSFNGECVATSYDEVSCNCNEGYFSDENMNCINPCTGQSCSNHGECVASDYNIAECNCDENYFNLGDDKFSCINPCSGETCSNHGSCSATDYNDAACECEEGYFNFGNDKFSCIDPCSGQICSNHGTCTATDYDNVGCNCDEADGYYQNPNDIMECLNPCNGEFCSYQGTCVSIAYNQASCSCNDGYFNNPDNNMECFNPCAGKTCSFNGECVATSYNEARCNCNEGYFINPDNIMECLNPCNGEYCSFHGSCTATSYNEASCVCNPGYEYLNNNEANEDKLTCVSKCFGNENCANAGICQLIEGDAVCSCYGGYQDNNENLTCKEPCIDDGTGASDCVENGVCNDVDSDAKHCDCDSGYQDNDWNMECTIGCDHSSYAMCSEYGECDDSDGVVKCICNEGYQHVEDRTACFWKEYVWTKMKTKGDGSVGIHGVTVENAGASYVVYDKRYQYSLVKYSIDGDILWEKTKSHGFDYGGYYRIRNINFNNNALFIVGTFGDTRDNVSSLNMSFDGHEYDIHSNNGYLDMFITKLDSDGNYLWTKTFGGVSHDYIYSINFDSSNNLYVTGDFRNTISVQDINNTNREFISKGESDIFIFKLNQSGDFIDGVSFGYGSYDNAYSISLDNNNNIYLTGSFEGRINFNPSDSNYEHLSNGNEDAFIVKLGADFEYIWSHSFGSYKWDSGYNILVKDEYLYLLGGFSGAMDFNPSEVDEIHHGTDYDIFLIKMSTSGEYQWSKTYPNTHKQSHNNTIQVNNDNIFIAGEFEGSVDFNRGFGEDIITSNGATDIFFTKLKTDGTYIKTEHWAGSDRDEGAILSNISNNSIIYIAGSFGDITGSVDFDPSFEEDLFSNYRYADAFLIKWRINPDE